MLLSAFDGKIKITNFRTMEVPVSEKWSNLPHFQTFLAFLHFLYSTTPNNSRGNCKIVNMLNFEARENPSTSKLQLGYHPHEGMKISITSFVVQYCFLMRTCSKKATYLCFVICRVPSYCHRPYNHPCNYHCSVYNHLCSYPLLQDCIPWLSMIDEPDKAAYIHLRSCWCVG